MPISNDVESMLRKRVFVVLAFVLALTAVATATASTTRLTTTETSVLVEMNKARAANGLAPLRVDTSLQRAARFHSTEMMRSGTFEHGNVAARIARFRVRASLIGENIGWGSGDRGSSAQLVAAWLASPPHRENLLRPSFRRVGVGALTGSFAGYGDAVVVTTDFAT